MPPVFKYKHYVGGNVLRGLVPLLWESNLGPLLPALLDDNVEDLVLCPHATPVWIQPATSDLHTLGAAVKDLLQRDFQLMNHWSILVLTVGPHTL